MYLSDANYAIQTFGFQESAVNYIQSLDVENGDSEAGTINVYSYTIGSSLIGQTLNYIITLSAAFWSGTIKIRRASSDINIVSNGDILIYIRVAGATLASIPNEPASIAHEISIPENADSISFNVTLPSSDYYIWILIDADGTGNSISSQNFTRSSLNSTLTVFEEPDPYYGEFVLRRYGDGAIIAGTGLTELIYEFVAINQ